MLEPAIQDKRRWWSREDVILLMILGALFLLPGLGQIPLFDRDEPRFATAARAMGESGDYIVPRFNGALRPDKPPLVYWLMNVGYAATGGWGELGSRLPSVICGILTLLVVYFMTGARFGRLTGMIAAMMLGSCVLFMVESRMATADGTMLFFIVVCMACAWQAWDAASVRKAPLHLPRADYLLDRSGDSAPSILEQMPPATPRRMPFFLAMLFWISLAAGTLTKGVPLAFVLVPMIVLSIVTGMLPEQLRQWRSHFHLTRGRLKIALAVIAAVTGYLIAVTSAHALPETRLWAMILGILLVGMVLTPGLPGVFARCFALGNWNWWRQLRPLIGVPLLVALVGWWVFLAGQATDWKLISDMVGTHFLLRVAGPLLKLLHIEIASAGGLGANDPSKGSALPPGTYLLMVWATFWPWCILLIPAAYHAVRRLRGRTPIAIDPRPYQFLACWIVPMWILLELSRGKLFHYPLPLYVGLAILCADTLVQSWHRLTDVLAAKWFGSLRWVTMFIWLGMGAGVLVGARLYLEQEWFWRCVPLGAALMAIGAAGTMTWGRPSWPFVLVLTWGGALMVANTLVMPDLPMLQVSRLVGGKMAALKKDDPSIHLAARGYQEATLVFYAGSNVEMIGSVDALLKRVTFDPSSKERFVIAVDDATLKALEERNIVFQTFATLPRVVGINMGNARPIGVTLITNVMPVSDISATTTVPETTPAKTSAAQ